MINPQHGILGAQYEILIFREVIKRRHYMDIIIIKELMLLKHPFQ